MGSNSVSLEFRCGTIVSVEGSQLSGQGSTISWLTQPIPLNSYQKLPRPYKDFQGHSRTSATFKDFQGLSWTLKDFQDLQGLSRTSKDFQGLSRSCKDFKGLSRTFMDIKDFQRLLRTSTFKKEDSKKNQRKIREE